MSGDIYENNYDYTEYLVQINEDNKFIKDKLSNIEKCSLIICVSFFCSVFIKMLFK